MTDSDIYDASFQKDGDIERFVDELRTRLYEGRAAYGNKSFDRAESKIRKERTEEALDGAGWSFVLWKKFRDSDEGKTLAEPNTLVDLGGAQAIVKSPEDLVNQIAEGLTEKRMLQPERYDDGDVWAVLLSDALDVVRKALMIEAPKS